MDLYQKNIHSVLLQFKNNLFADSQEQRIFVVSETFLLRLSAAINKVVSSEKICDNKGMLEGRSMINNINSIGHKILPCSFEKSVIF